MADSLSIAAAGVSAFGVSFLFLRAMGFEDFLQLYMDETPSESRVVNLSLSGMIAILAAEWVRQRN